MAIIEDLVVSDYGAFIGLHGGRVRVDFKTAKSIDAPLLHLRSIQIHSRSVSISAAALAACCEAGIPVHFVDAFVGNYATVLSPTLTTVMNTRRQQMTVIANERGVEIARQIGFGKVKSQVANLRYLARRQPEAISREFHLIGLDMLDTVAPLETLQAEKVEDIRAYCMGIEGHCASLYWGALKMLIPVDEYQWTGRTGRHADDPINMLLNYGYGILYGEVQNALVIAGLEPYAGLLHTDRPGKPSLTLDLIEEFRAPIVDRTVIGLINRHYEVRFDENGKLDRDFRKNFAEHILSRLNAQGVYTGKRYQLRSIIQLQARLLAAAFRGEATYAAYTGG